MEELPCQADACWAGDESSLAHRGTSGGATGVSSVLNSVRKYTDFTAVGLGIVLVQTCGLVLHLKEKSINASCAVLLCRYVHVVSI